MCKEHRGLIKAMRGRCNLNNPTVLPVIMQFHWSQAAKAKAMAKHNKGITAQLNSSQKALFQTKKTIKSYTLCHPPHRKMQSETRPKVHLAATIVSQHQCEQRKYSLRHQTP